MELADLYRYGSNPIDNPNIVKKLINIYSESEADRGEFYGLLVNFSPCYKSDTNQNDMDYYYSKMGNEWIKNLLTVNNPKYSKFRNYVGNSPRIHNRKEFEEFLKNKVNDPELQEQMSLFAEWKPINGRSWKHVKSRYLTLGRENRINVEHRFYLNVSKPDLYKFLNILTDKIEKNYFPYYYKYSDTSNRDDSIVIYCPTEDIPKYISIFNEIQKDYPDLVSRIKKPPFITYNFNGWVGYGSEPGKDAFGKNQSYNDLRTKVLIKAIDNSTREYLKHHQLDYIAYNGKQMTYKEFFINKYVEFIFDEFTEDYESFKRYHRDEQKEEREGKMANVYGYNGEDLNNPSFKNYITRNVSQFVNSNFDSLLGNTCNDHISVHLRDKNSLELSQWAFNRYLAKMASDLSDRDSRFIGRVQESIKEIGEKNGIDRNNFCFDSRFTNEFKKVNNRAMSEKTNVGPKPPVRQLTSEEAKNAEYQQEGSFWADYFDSAPKGKKK